MLGVNGVADDTEGSQFLYRLRQLAGALPDLLLQTIRDMLFLDQQLISFPGILAKNLGDLSHFGNLVAAADFDGGLMTAS